MRQRPGIALGYRCAPDSEGSGARFVAIVVRVAKCIAPLKIVRTFGVRMRDVYETLETLETADGRFPFKWLSCTWQVTHAACVFVFYLACFGCMRVLVRVFVPAISSLRYSVALTNPQPPMRDDETPCCGVACRTTALYQHHLSYT